MVSSPPARSTEPMVVDLTPAACTSGFIGRLKQLFDQHPGGRPVVLQVVVEGEATRLRLGEECCVNGSPELLAELRRLLGPGAVHDGPAAEPARAAAPSAVVSGARR